MIKFQFITRKCNGLWAKPICDLEVVPTDQLNQKDHLWTKIELKESVIR